MEFVLKIHERSMPAINHTDNLDVAYALLTVIRALGLLERGNDRYQNIKDDEGNIIGTWRLK